MKKYRSCKLFQTLNEAKKIWDPGYKNKGLLGGHLNVRSLTSKREQMEHLMINFNIDFIGLSETWLSPSIVTLRAHGRA